MKLFKVMRIDQIGWDEFDSFVCVANSELNARRMHPRGNKCYVWDDINNAWHSVIFGKNELEYHSWTCNIDRLNVELIGNPSNTHEKEFVVLASFNAG